MSSSTQATMPPEATTTRWDGDPSRWCAPASHHQTGYRLDDSKISRASAELDILQGKPPEELKGRARVPFGAEWGAKKSRNKAHMPAPRRQSRGDEELARARARAEAGRRRSARH
ncbi:unnamed protein product [Symbiodinium sp. CCMP2592]|nr:unnamed protein product [Symbiodinium sp. CCMP2592]